MNSRALRLKLLTAVALAGLMVCMGRPCTGADPAGTPFVVLLADDVDTRGDWIGTYGTYAYILCGMRSPHPLSGGKFWPLVYSVDTGDPKESARAWRSSAPAANDRSVLLEPSGLKRTAASFDDHGEVRPLGKGPDLHIRVSVPAGPFLVSLYFFEIDWIQYRAYRIKLYAQEEERRLLAETTADNFLKGKYKRFVVYGPLELVMVIERGQSPNAQVSGIFLDELDFPDMFLFDAAQNAVVADGLEGEGVPDSSMAEHAAERVLAALLADPDSAGTWRDYAKHERILYRALKELEHSQPVTYYRELNEIWGRVEDRIKRATDALGGTPSGLDAILLRYFAARAHCDYQTARQEMRNLVEALSPRGQGLVTEMRGSPALLYMYLTHVMSLGRRDEATILLRAYTRHCLEDEVPDVSKEKLIRIGKRALRAGVSLPVAQALADFQERHGELSTEERLLLANLYYVAARNEEATRVYETVEPEMTHGAQHRWVLIAMLTSLLRSDRVHEAELLLKHLERTYPGADEIDEAKYRFGVHYFDMRDMEPARNCFRRLQTATESKIYEEMCNQYLERIEHLESVGSD